jgi:hypothetical protein
MLACGVDCGYSILKYFIKIKEKGASSNVVRTKPAKQQQYFLYFY